MNIRKTTIASIALSSMIFSGCASINSGSYATPNSSSSEFEERKPSEGTDMVLPILAIAVLIGVAFAVAPAEAYK